MTDRPKIDEAFLNALQSDDVLAWVIEKHLNSTHTSKDLKTLANLRSGVNSAAILEASVKRFLDVIFTGIEVCFHDPGCMKGMMKGISQLKEQLEADTTSTTTDGIGHHVMLTVHMAVLGLILKVYEQKVNP